MANLYWDIPLKVLRDVVSCVRSFMLAASQQLASMLFDNIIEYRRDEYKYSMFYDFVILGNVEEFILVMRKLGETKKGLISAIFFHILIFSNINFEYLYRPIILGG